MRRSHGEHHRLSTRRAEKISNAVEPAKKWLGPLATLRLAKTINNADEATKKEIAEAAESLEGWCGYLVVAAIILEGLIYVVPFFVTLAQQLVDLGEFVSSLLVGAGVYGEIRFSGIASRVVKLRLAEAENNAMLAFMEATSAGGRAASAAADAAKANRELAEAKERAAKLEKEAAEARERTAELERLTSPRRMTPEDRQGIVDAIRPIAANLKLLVQCQSSDAEAFGYAQAIATAFKVAGVTEIELTANSFRSGLVFGVHAQTDTVDLGEKIATLDRYIESPFLVTQRDLTLVMTLAHFRPNLYFFVGPRFTPGAFEADTEDSVQPTFWG